MFVVCVSSSAGDETQANLAIVQASSKDSGVYGCSITNEYGTDSTDFLLSADSMFLSLLATKYIHNNNHFSCVSGCDMILSVFPSHCFSVLAGMFLREDLGGEISFIC